ncbi:MAG: hypothetical protein QOG46_903 [Pseudonocardiales bacterium]|jgi:hypothetical protein|nr:hypothetical protein [Pseudonocardiales bacterium]
MGRLLVLLTTVLLCIAGAGLASAAVAPIIHHSSAARPATVSPPGRVPATAAGDPNTGILPGAATISPSPSNSSLTADTTPASSLADRATAPARVKQATQGVLPNAQVGFEVFDRADNTILTSEDADQQFAAMSVVKLLIALDVLSRNDWATPEGATQQELRQMLANSDDQIANTLWTAGGGPAIVTRMTGTLGLEGTQPPGDPGEWGDTLITPHDMVTVYRYIADQLPKPDQDLILGALAETPKIAADGFDQYFGIPDGMPNISWAVKQGWGTSGAQAVMNSTGLVGSDWRYVVVVLASAPGSSYSTLPAVVTAGAGALTELVGAAAF